ncbi:MAG: ATP-dependent DNA helicase [Candidatus Aenigmarchaeota archaeon]|nr:ATP-dependent DNA helicase [Candidatus Aenigmarchaeota archaeon]
MLFPFSSVRPQQKEFMDDVRSAVSSGSHLIANAPTGIGKTAAALSPALEYALENQKTVFFLTPRHSQHVIALETLKKLREKASFRVADLIGKKWLCSYDMDDFSSSEFTDFCHSLVKDERCPFYKASRTDDRTMTAQAKAALAGMDGFLHAEEFKHLVSKNFCAYELLMEAARTSSVVIADYYHIFSPARAATLLRLKKEMKDIIFIVDEAHNLPARVRDLMSEKLTSFSLVRAEEEAEKHGLGEAKSIASQAYNALNALAKGEESYVTKEAFLGEIERRIGNVKTIIETLEEASSFVRKNARKSYLASLLKFITSWEAAGEGYVRTIRKAPARTGGTYVSLSLSCLDPSLFTKEVIEGSHSTVLMSGTLYPQDMYREILGVPKNVAMKSYDSPFRKENRLNIILPSVTTKYSTRNEESYKKIASYVSSCINAIKGNCAVFFPSYAFRDAVRALIKVEKPVLLEEKEANKEQRQQLYNRFVSLHRTGAALLAVQAGSFSEGVDMAGDFLNGVIVVGIPLEHPDLETKALIDYYDTRFGRGWDFGYAYPAMIRSIQAAGRCIRTENDRGVCVFMDQRFLWSNYRKVFPADLRFVVTDAPEQEIRAFWRKPE